MTVHLPVPSRRTAAVSVAAAAAIRPMPSPAEGTVVPDLPRLDRDRAAEVPWTGFSIAGLVLLVVVVAAGVVFLADRGATAASERRRRAPPRSILGARRW